MSRQVNLTQQHNQTADHVNQAIARHIKHYRSQHRLSLDELSRRTGVSKGTLVDIEQAKANPGIAVLCKIASSIGTSVAELVEINPCQSVRLQPIAPQQMPVLWQGEQGGMAMLLAGTQDKNMLELWQWKLAPGETFSAPAHSPGTVELLYVQQGQLTLILGDDTQQLAPGHAVIAKTDLPHQYRAHDSQTTEFIMAVYEPAH